MCHITYTHIQGESHNEVQLSQQPYIQAVRDFHSHNYGNIISLCTKAIESGELM